MKTTTPKDVPQKTVPKLDIDLARVGAQLYADLRDMGQHARLAKGMMPNWAIGAIREAAERFVIRQMVLDEIAKDPKACNGLFAVRKPAMTHEVDRVTTGITKAILGEAAKAELPIARKAAQAGKEQAA